jgi:hypothetical protein
MKFIGMRDDNRPGLLCLNSWRPNAGPKGKYDDIPDGSFWIDSAICDYMIKNGGAFTVGSFDGYAS